MNRTKEGLSQPIPTGPGSPDEALVALLVELSEPVRAAEADEREAVERALAVLEVRGADAGTSARARRRSPGVFVGLAVAAAVALAVLPRHQPAPDRAVEPLASAAHAALSSLATARAPSDRVREIVSGPPRRGGRP